MTRAEFTIRAGKCYSSLLGFLTGLCGGDSDTAADLLQDTLLRAWVFVADLRDESSFEFWLKSIALNIFRSNLKKYANPTTFVPIGESEIRTYTPEGESPDEITDRDIRNHILHRAIEKLPPDEQELVRLYYFDSRTVAEISGITGKKKGTIMSLIHRARAKLKKLMEKNRL